MIRRSNPEEVRWVYGPERKNKREGKREIGTKEIISSSWGGGKRNR